MIVTRLDGQAGRPLPALAIPDYLTARNAAQPRSRGLHHSDLVHYILRRLRYEEPDPVFIGWEYAALTGFLFEDAMSEQLARYDWGVQLIRGLELLEDGIYMSPDGVNVETGELWEFKFTWRGLKKSPPESRLDWLMQLKSYCRAVRTDSAILCSLFACGDYSPPKPQLLFTRFAFTERELEDNWKTILGSVGGYQAELAEKRLEEEKREKRKGSWSL